MPHCLGHHMTVMAVHYLVEHLLVMSQSWIHQCVISNVDFHYHDRINNKDCMREELRSQLTGDSEILVLQLDDTWANTVMVMILLDFCKGSQVQ